MAWAQVRRKFSLFFDGSGTARRAASDAASSRENDYVRGQWHRTTLLCLHRRWCVCSGAASMGEEMLMSGGRLRRDCRAGDPTRMRGASGSPAGPPQTVEGMRATDVVICNHQTAATRAATNITSSTVNTTRLRSARKCQMHAAVCSEGSGGCGGEAVVPNTHSSSD